MNFLKGGLYRTSLHVMGCGVYYLNVDQQHPVEAEPMTLFIMASNDNTDIKAHRLHRMI